MGELSSIAKYSDVHWFSPFTSWIDKNINNILNELSPAQTVR